MKMAIPVFHTKISPRFDETQGFVLLETENASVVAKENLATKGWSVIEKMKQLVELEIDTLICGGIDRASMQYLSFNGVKVYSWVTGEIDDAVVCFLDNRMKPGIILGEQGKMKGRWQFCNGRNHLCNMFQTEFNEKGVKTMPRGDGTGPKGQGPRAGMDRGGCKTGKRGRSNDQSRGQGFGQGRGGGSVQERGDGVKERRKGNNE
jgi:predicted Fe-Mo cluster-binding NifX family protein